MKIGLERVLENPKLLNSIGPFALLSNQASVDKGLQPSWKQLHQAFPTELKCLFGPQHGFESTVQDNMIETEHAIHPPSGLPLYSLYSETREPTPKMLEGVDTILIDIQISGTRIYTYKYTIAACLRAAKKLNKKVIVLDRPNPLGGEIVEGNVLHEGARSFVGEFAIPMRHGLTPGEAAIFFNREIQAELDVIWMDGWSPADYWCKTGRHWVLTSPNLPTPDSVYVYPGMVLFEGTNISEGRGTTRPFQFIGAPAIKHSRQYIERVIEILGGPPTGLFMRATSFQPTFHKWKNEECYGVDLIVTDPKLLRTFKLGLAMIRAGIEMMDREFKWAQPPYEYNYTDLPIDLLLGKKFLSKELENSKFSVQDSIWMEGIDAYLEQAGRIQYYDRNLKS